MRPRNWAVAVGAALVLGAASLFAQNTVIRRDPPQTLKGQIVDMFCYRAKGIEGANAALCQGMPQPKTKNIGILSEGDGLFRIIGGDWDKNNYAKLIPLLGQTVEISGAQVLLSNSYDVRNFEVAKLTPVKK